ncbi:MAG: tyrosine-type recombinase/integrase [Chloroflexi bacterium]|nr:tyrosine-type recombinase/integrase [Chloroflexota bacterium]
MEDKIEAFLAFVAQERGLSANTKSAYRNDLTQLDRFVVRHSNGNGIDSAVIGDFVRWLRQGDAHGGGYAQATVARKIAAVRSLFHFLVQHGHIVVDPTQHVKAPHVGKTPPKTLSVEGLERLLAEAGKETTPDGLRDRAMLTVLAETGMRVSELVALNLTDVSLTSGSVRCLGRRPRERLIPLGRGLDALDDYLQQGRPQLARSAVQEALFLNHRGERLTRQGFWLILKGHARSAGLDRSVTPYTLRHSFAARQLAAGADLKSVQRVLGHASPSSTHLYAQLVAQERATASLRGQR